MSQDFPFSDVVEKASQLIRNGCTVHQKFTCGKCGQRLTVETPNVFHQFGTCDKCGFKTDIRKQGCNYLLIGQPGTILSAG